MAGRSPKTRNEVPLLSWTDVFVLIALTLPLETALILPFIGGTRERIRGPGVGVELLTAVWVTLAFTVSVALSLWGLAPILYNRAPKGVAEIRWG